jgi:hypothetical protein
MNVRSTCISKGMEDAADTADIGDLGADLPGDLTQENLLARNPVEVTVLMTETNPLESVSPAK